MGSNWWNFKNNNIKNQYNKLQLKKLIEFVNN